MHLPQAGECWGQCFHIYIYAISIWTYIYKLMYIRNLCLTRWLACYLSVTPPNPLSPPSLSLFHPIFFCLSLSLSLSLRLLERCRHIAGICGSSSRRASWRFSSPSHFSACPRDCAPHSPSSWAYRTRPEVHMCQSNYARSKKEAVLIATRQSKKRNFWIQKKTAKKNGTWLVALTLFSWTKRFTSKFCLLSFTCR